MGEEEEEDNRDYFSITNMEHGKGLHVAVLILHPWMEHVCDPESSASARIFSPTLRLGSLCSAPRRAAGNIHTLPQTAECKLQSWGEGFQKRGERHKRVAWHLELVSNCTQISLLPAVNQPICGVLIHTVEIPREEPLELICWCSK